MNLWGKKSLTTSSPHTHSIPSFISFSFLPYFFLPLFFPLLSSLLISFLLIFFLPLAFSLLISFNLYSFLLFFPANPFFLHPSLLPHFLYFFPLLHPSFSVYPLSCYFSSFPSVFPSYLLFFPTLQLSALLSFLSTLIPSFFPSYLQLFSSSSFFTFVSSVPPSLFFIPLLPSFLTTILPLFLPHFFSLQLFFSASHVAFFPKPFPHPPSFLYFVFSISSFFFLLPSTDLLGWNDPKLSIWSDFLYHVPKLNYRPLRHFTFKSSWTL